MKFRNASVEIEKSFTEEKARSNSGKKENKRKNAACAEYAST